MVNIFTTFIDNKIRILINFIMSSYTYTHTLNIFIWNYVLHLFLTVNESNL